MTYHAAGPFFLRHSNLGAILQNGLLRPMWAGLRDSVPLGFLEVHFFMSFYDLGALTQMVAAFMISFYFPVVADDRRFLHFFFVSLSLLFSLSSISLFCVHSPPPRDE